MKHLVLAGLLMTATASARPLQDVIHFLGYEPTQGPAKTAGELWRWPMTVTNMATDAVVPINVTYIRPAGKKYASQVGAEYVGGFGQGTDGETFFNVADSLASQCLSIHSSMNDIAMWSADKVFAAIDKGGGTYRRTFGIVTARLILSPMGGGRYHAFLLFGRTGTPGTPNWATFCTLP